MACGKVMRRATAAQLWDAAEIAERKAWLRSTGSWVSDADLSWKQLMAQGGSQAEVMADHLRAIAKEVR